MPTNLVSVGSGNSWSLPTCFILCVSSTRMLSKARIKGSEFSHNDSNETFPERFYYALPESGKKWWKEIDNSPQIPTGDKRGPACQHQCAGSVNPVLITGCVRSPNITSADTKSWNPIFTGAICGRGLLLIKGLHSPCPQACLNEGRLLTTRSQSSGSQTPLLSVLCAVSCQWLLGEVHFVMETKLLFSYKTPPRFLS